MQKIKALALSFCGPCNYLAVAVWAILVTLHFVSFDTYVWLGTEDRLGENMTSVFYFAAAVLLVMGSIRNIRNGSSSFPRETLPLLLALFFIFIAGEEISWGQRLLGIDTPDAIRNNNVQGELTLHNLTFFDRNAAVLNQHTALNVFALLMGFLIPLADAVFSWARRLLQKLNFPLVPLSCCLWFLLGLVNGQTTAKLYPHWAHTEIKELAFSVGFFLFALVLYRSRKTEV